LVAILLPVCPASACDPSLTRYVAGQGRYFNADENHYQLDLCLFLIFFASR